jgi:hypothetical protein
MSAAAPRLPPELLAMMARGVSVIVASCDAQRRPSVMRAVGSQVAPDASAVTVYLARRQSRQLLEDVAASGRVAVVFSEPTTHRAVQLKASGATLRPATKQDAPVLAAYLAAMEAELQCIGIAPPLTRTMLAHRLEDVVALQFAPEQAFEQTPGPRAGAGLGGTQ